MGFQSQDISQKNSRGGTRVRLGIQSQELSQKIRTGVLVRQGASYASSVESTGCLCLFMYASLRLRVRQHSACTREYGSRFEYMVEHSLLSGRVQALPRGGRVPQRTVTPPRW